MSVKEKCGLGGGGGGGGWGVGAMGLLGKRKAEEQRQKKYVSAQGSAPS